ncbi:4-phosphoerythronate dehydrogenase [Maribrevibacterium harenarium]|uniref:Erythronate-4-phosphate dehydrogenase n=1 Tax=Maribrevibacterium harenarium TaxID=2589817 RepID=A0A501WGS1_9GAMM|nr:4-phosphoerythronate dehydrogenase [Maribrevibacterium harenarium]TPE47254.1 4-phosphoerythronate dehydrogenase [Maribrevibacterium harenarium]
MKILADENMPNVHRLFGGLGEVVTSPGRTLTPAMLDGVDVLLVRSVTKVNEALLKDSSVKFVGTATIGTDHIDLEYLAQRGIGFASAPGCNADAVADYVFSALSYLYLTRGVTWLNAKIGILGHGNVGKVVASRFKALGCDVCAYDPLLADSQFNVEPADLATVMACDVICHHAPFTAEGEYPTKGMINADLIANLQPGQTIVAAGRGGVIDEIALVKRQQELQGSLNLVFDVWQGEPEINRELAPLCDIVTPHIAGYSKQGREKGTWMVYQSLCQFFGLEVKIDYQTAVSRGSIGHLELNVQPSLHDLIARACHAIYDVARDSNRFRYSYLNGSHSGVFDWLRKHYVERDEFGTCQVRHASLGALGFELI